MQLLNVTQVAEILLVSSQLVYKLTKERELPFYHIGRLIRISFDDIQEYLKSQRKEKKA